MRSAVFLPMPGAFVSVLPSPDATQSANACGVIPDNIDSAALGPTPETEISILKQLSSAAS